MRLADQDFASDRTRRYGPLPDGRGYDLLELVHNRLRRNMQNPVRLQARVHRGGTKGLRSSIFHRRSSPSGF